MMFIVRGNQPPPAAAGLQVKVTRATPAIVESTAGMTDFFCVGEAAAIASLREAGFCVVELRDGYYEDGRGGGVAIWGQGKYWEIRAEPLTVTEAVGPGGSDDAAPKEGEHIEVRRAIFGA